jgi:hypothetical protein
MSDQVSDNPYQSPQSPVNPAADSSGRLTETMLFYLKGASPWLRFIGIVGFISCGLIVLGGIVFLALIPAMGALWTEMPEIEEYADIFGALFGVFTGVYLFLIAVLGFFPSLFIYNFGARIRSYLRSGADQELETAFKNNKSLWKFAGILTIISLAFIPLMVIAGIIIGIASVFA